MGKFSKLLGAAVVFGAAAGTYKYLKDYHNLKLTKESELDNVSNDAAEVKEAAKRTYIALKNSESVSEPASDLLKAAGNILSDAEKIAVTAGEGISAVADDISAKYEENPDQLKAQVVENVKDMGQKIISGIKSDIFDDIASAAGNSSSSDSSHTNFGDDDDDDIFDSFETV